jgi:hypothetical protein
MDTINLETKTQIAALARKLLHSQLMETRQQLSELNSSGAEEGKSSAGDKYETQREMIKQSQEILDRQLSRIQAMINQLEKIPIEACSQVQEGALVKLPLGLVWVGVALGRIVDQNVEYLLVSKDSPLFIAIKGLKRTQSTLFRGKKMMIEEVI